MTGPVRKRHMLGCIRVRASAEATAAVVRGCSSGMTLTQLCASMPEYSRRMVMNSAEDAIAAGLIVRCGSGSRNFRYAAVEHAAQVRALIAAAATAANAAAKIRDRARVRRRGVPVARPYSARELKPDLPVRRVIVPAAQCEPLAPHVRGPVSVWHMGQGT